MFDFDQTLIRENSLGSLFKSVSGHRLIWPHAVPAFFTKKCWSAGVRQAIKEHLYKRYLIGISECQLYELGQKQAHSYTPISEVVDALQKHAAGNGEVWIVTASPAPFVRGIIDSLGWPYHCLIGTNLPEVDGLYNGDLGLECSHEEKVININKAVRKQNGLVDLELAYGNLPPDLPMLLMAEKAFIVTEGKVRKLRKCHTLSVDNVLT
ncbi:HAD family hydrolase [Microbulbifer guangxiensis]|uniref:HAD family hydrolase n=1 Tax=Microbulbifer guangxiensis TaxID=2904249 RepID=UPI001F310FB8|nr:HAD family hydrolase [Microbulbifer guangxiensis]